MKDGLYTIGEFASLLGVSKAVIYKWENKSSFTSSLMTENWIKITGYFVDKQWKKAAEELWVKKINTIKR